jgi:hypothetical protein
MRFWSMVLASLGVACGGPAVGDLEERDVVFSLTALGAPEGLTLTHAFVSASSLSLLPCNAADLVLDGRGYDLLGDPPPSERITTATNELCGLRIDVDPVDKNAQAGVPDGASLYVEATDTDDATISFTSENSFSLLFELEEGGSLPVEPLLVGFDTSAWLAGLPLAMPDDDRTAQLFDQQLYDAAALYVDHDGNGALEGDETTPLCKARKP